MTFWKKKDNLIITGCVVLFFAGLAIWFDFCCVRASFFSESGSTSAFQLPFVDKDQKKLTLNDFKGKPLVVNFWATWCPLCVKKMPSFNRFAGKFQEKGGKVLAISQDRGGISKVRAYFTRNSFQNLDIYIEATGKLLSAFGGRGLPTTVFIDAQGNEVGRVTGGIDWDGAAGDDLIEKYFGINLSE